MGGRYGQGIDGTHEPPAIAGQGWTAGKGRHATHPEKEREENGGAPNCYSDISALKKFMEVIPTPCHLHIKR
jgi:hypothetical protein